jgi:4-hydroxy-tetrahydrodipicolinate synthase
MVTPFDEQGGLDLDGAVELARWLVEHGSDALVLAGTTGEGPVLADSEKLDLWRAVAEEVTVPVIAGTGTADTAHSIELTRQAEKAGADGVLVVTPYYSRPSQAGLEAHFRAVADATRLPVILYDIPGRTGRKIATDTLVSLARSVGNLVGVKDAAGDVVASGRLVAGTPDGFELYSGDDALTLPLMSIGAVGVISVASHWVGPELGAMIEAFRIGDVAGARALNARLDAAVAFQSSETYPNPLPAKAVCRALGLRVGQCRLPIGPATEELDRLAADLVASLGSPGGAGGAPTGGTDGAPTGGAATDGAPTGGAGGAPTGGLHVAPPGGANG